MFFCIRFHENDDLNWHWLSVTVHVILEHGADLIRVLPIAAGLSSEEVGEANNKILRHDRAHHTPMTSQAAAIKNLFDRRTHMSSPQIRNEIGKIVLPKRKRSSVLPDGVKALLKPNFDEMVVNDTIEEAIDSDDDDNEEQNELMTLDDALNEIELISFDDFQ